MPHNPARRDFRQGFFDGASQPLRKTCGIPAAPLRAIPDESPGARRGIRGVNPVKVAKDISCFVLLENWSFKDRGNQVGAWLPA